MIRILPTAVQPVAWQICFHREATTWLAKFLAFGKYKHVSAYAYLPGIRGWLIYDVHFDATHLVVLPDNDEALRILEAITRDCDVLRMNRRTGPAFTLRFGFFCTTAIKHLIGLRGSTLRADALYRHCIRQGAEIVHEKKPAASPADPNGAAIGRAGAQA